MADYNYRNMYGNVVQILDMLGVQKLDHHERPLNGVYRMHLLYDEVEALRKENERLRALNSALVEAEQLAKETGVAVIVVKGLPDD
jgi:hypothetical protein